MASTFAAVSTSPRRPLSRLLLACIVILVLAQILIGALSLSALNRLVADNTADRIELSARQSANHIQTGLNLGKPLAQYFGLDDVLEALNQQAPGLLGTSVVLADGHVLASTGHLADASEVLAAINGQAAPSDQRVVMTSAGVAREFSRDYARLAIALIQPGVSARGALIVDMNVSGAAQTGLLKENVSVLVAITLGAALLLIVLLRYVVPAYGATNSSRMLKLVPILVLLAAQALYASYTITSFRTVWLGVTQDNARLVVQGVQRDLNQVLSYGIAPQKLVGVEGHMARVMESFPVIQELRLHDPDGAVLARAGAQGALPGVAASWSDADKVIHAPLYVTPDLTPVATLSAILDPEQLRAGVWDRVLDAGTIAVIAVVTAMELLLLLELALGTDWPMPARTPELQASNTLQATRTTLLARPIMFGFLFAWALPLGFLPLYARSLIPVETAPEQLQFLMAMPIVAEMGLGLMTVLLAGRLSDTYGWQRPVLAGLLISIVASVACAVAGSLGTFVVARSLVGIGYGLTWMGLQGFVVLNSPASSRGRNMASVIAGLFAGHLSGVAVGAMLMQQLGYRAVFYSGALLYVLPLLGALIVAGLYRRASQAPVDVLSTIPAAVGPPVTSAALPVLAASAATAGNATKTSESAKSGPGSSCVVADPHLIVCAAEPVRISARKLILSRDFALLLLASIVPFSIAQVGLLSFALPLYLEAGGFQASSVGRVIMIYGLCVIYVGPFMGQLADRSSQKKHWIVAAGLVGSVGLLSFSVFEGIGGAIVAVLCLAVASCLAAGAQTAYMLGLKNVERYGAVGATSLMRAADKAGQMLGPLIVAGLFAVTSMSLGLALTGALYLFASLTFMLVASGSRDHRGNSGKPAS